MKAQHYYIFHDKKTQCFKFVLLVNIAIYSFHGLIMR